MGLLIEVNTSTLTPEEATALVSMCAILHPGSVQADALDRATVGLIPAATPKAPPLAPANAADALMAAESARVAALAPAPAPTALVATHAPNGAELDAEGLPWDARIHSEAKGKLKNGTWKVARNMDPEKVNAVKAELRAALGANPPVPVGGAPAFVIQVDNAGPAPAPAGAPPLSAYANATFADAMGRVVDLTVAGVSVEAINASLATLGLSQARDLSMRPDLVPHAMAAMATLGA